MFPSVGEAMVRLLERQGVRVEFPEGQTCCGQPAFNSGYWDDARTAARNVLDAFDDSDFVIAPSGSCVYMLHHYRELFKDDPKRLGQAERLAAKTYEFSQFLVQVLGVRDLGAYFPHKVTYHPPVTAAGCSASGKSRSSCSPRCAGSNSFRCRSPKTAAGSAAPSP